MPEAQGRTSTGNESSPTVSVDLGHEEERLLMGEKAGGMSNGPSRQRRGLRWFLVTASLVASMGLNMLAGFYIRDSVRTGYYNHEKNMYNFDDLTTLPGLVGDYLKKHPKAGDSFFTMTSSPFSFGLQAPLWHQPPSRPVDAFWERMSPGSVILLTEAEMRQMHKEPSLAVHLPLDKDTGYGERKYIAKLDHLHQIHCLNHLRQAGHPEYYNLTSAAQRLHTDHCVRSLFDYLMCHVSWDVFNYYWVEGQARPQPDFTSARQCRDVEGMFDFYRAHDVSKDARVRYIVPGDDARYLPQDPGMFPYFELAFQVENPGSPPDELVRKFREKKFNAAQAKFERTGEIPRWDEEE